ncbi:MAG TPA: sensor domain-containing diguanylate cyclase [Candidatus Limiplasma sp.]|nr:sensor domain-containing diguanylate cyclase [Candidatus Limiplasma sp.]
MQFNDPWTSVFENLHEGAYFVDTDRKITYWNKGAELISGYSAAEVIGTCCYDNVLLHTNCDGIQLCMSGCPLLDSLQRNEINSASVYLQHKAGYRVPVSVRTVPITENGRVTGALEIFQTQQDKSGSASHLEELKMLALTDPLTSLPNRRYTESFLASKIRDANQLGIQFGILFFDIDHFKSLNDRYGHAAGDGVLQNLAHTFISNFRSTDLIGRWGGEEFLGICVCADAGKLLQIAEKTRVLTENTVTQAQEDKIQVTISVGVTLYRPGETPQQAIARADALMYRAKAEGRNRTAAG